MLTPNPFVYQKIYQTDVKSPTIPSLLEEQYAQCAEDLIVLSILNAMYTTGRLKDISNSILVEIGGNHGFAGSNSYLIGKSLGITTLIAEANPELIQDLIVARPNDQIVHTAIVNSDDDTIDLYVSNHHELSSLSREFVTTWHEGKVGMKSQVKVPAVRLNQFFEKHIYPGKRILFLSIDIEGMDLAIAADIDFSRWRPMLVQMEPSDHHQPKESDRMIEFMMSQDYLLIAKTRVNLIFMDKFSIS
jgi:Methyltransferase FkbM domain